MATVKGPQALLAWATREVRDEVLKAIRDLRNFGCAKCNKIIGELRAQGADLPKKIDDWSCDQKIAFIAGLGPFGIQCLMAGSLVGKLASDTQREYKRFEKNAEKSAKHVGDQLSNAAGAAATSIGNKLGL